MDREGRLAATFVDLADTLVGDYEVLEFLYLLCERTAAILDVDAVGVLLADEQDVLRVTSASHEQTHLLELFELQQLEGPCPDAYRSGQHVVEEELERAAGRWPQFACKAIGAGYRAVYAFPLRLRQERIGALNMFRTRPGAFGRTDVVTGQALADVATIGILQQRKISRAEIRAEQLQQALNTRVVIEQAKGIVAERLGVDTGAAFDIVRAHARKHGQRLHDVARQIIDGTLTHEVRP